MEVPEEYVGREKSLFLAGGISNCSNWQKEIIEKLIEEDLVLINPRRENFNIDNLDMEKEQITWEFNHLKKADFVSFWFPSETVCPITLYELGKMAALNKKIFVGVHPEYSRKRDVQIQLSLIRPEVKIVYSIEELVNQIKSELKK